MLLNSVDVLLKGAIERDALCPQYQLVKVLPLLGFNSQAGVDVSSMKVSSKTMMFGCDRFQALAWNIAVGGPPVQSMTT